jgi:surface antigen
MTLIQHNGSSRAAVAVADLDGREQEVSVFACRSAGDVVQELDADHRAGAERPVGHNSLLQ